jgi:hypothetical protein
LGQVLVSKFGFVATAIGIRRKMPFQMRILYQKGYRAAIPRLGETSPDKSQISPRRCLSEARIAEFHSADRPKSERPADWKSAIQQVGNLRYGPPAQACARKFVIYQG